MWWQTNFSFFCASSRLSTRSRDFALVVGLHIAPDYRIAVDVFDGNSMPEIADLGTGC
jgi:hypothetical protein